MTHYDCDICIIGGGSGGLSLAAGAAQMGVKVILFEAAAMGGDCLNSGCVPSKALLAVAKAAHYASGAPHMGVTATPPTINFAAVKAHVAAVIDGIAPHDSVERFEALGVNVITEHAAFTGPHEVVSNHHRVRAKYFVIATGSQPVIPPIDGLEDADFHTNETIFADPAKPSHLVIIGGGPIGMEMAQAHIRLGVDVTLVEALSVMARDDGELVTIPSNFFSMHISRVADYLIVKEVANSWTLKWDGDESIFIKVDEALMGQTGGLCGVFDHDQANDLTTRDGTTVKSVALFANSWKTSDQCLEASSGIMITHGRNKLGQEFSVFLV